MFREQLLRPGLQLKAKRFKFNARMDVSDRISTFPEHFNRIPFTRIPLASFEIRARTETNLLAYFQADQGAQRPGPDGAAATFKKARKPTVGTTITMMT